MRNRPEPQLPRHYVIQPKFIEIVWSKSKQTFAIKLWRTESWSTDWLRMSPFEWYALKNCQWVELADKNGKVQAKIGNNRGALKIILIHPPEGRQRPERVGEEWPETAYMSVRALALQARGGVDPEEGWAKEAERRDEAQRERWS